jgi:hypothetical protein
MTPCQEFRFWARRAPSGERAAAGIATLVVIALLVWLLVPGGGGGATSLAAGSGRAGTSAEGPSGSSSVGAASGAQTGGAAAAGSTASAGGAAGARSGPAAASSAAGGSGPVGPGCPPLAAGTKGVSASQMKIAVMLVDIAGPAADNTFGIAPPAQQKADYEALLDSFNKAGGIACRKVVAQYYTVNPADQNDQQNKCLTAVQAQPFAVVDPGSYSFTSPMCFPQHHMPYFGGFFNSLQQSQQAYPYLFNLGTYDHLYRDTALGFRDRGAFDPAQGFKKLGLIYRDCHKELVDEEFTALHQAGLADDQIVSYDFGCPSAFASPSDIQQAILKFKSAGVTHATGVYVYGDLANFTNVAQQQGFKPQYVLADEGIIAISYGNLRPNPANIANALAITSGRYAEERTPGMQPTPGTAACDAMYQAHGLPPTYKVDPEAGNACNELWMIKAGAEHAPVLSAETLAVGLQRTRSIDFSYPNGPNDFSGSQVTLGGQFWRVTQYFADCSCWRVIDPTFHPNHP